MCDKLVPPDQSEIPEDTGSPNLLQLTSATFLIPGAMCVQQGKLIGVVVHCGNAVCSVYVHRPDRTKKDNWVDVLDHILVFAWVSYNTYLLFKDPTPPLYVPAVVCAGVVLASKIWTRYLKYRSLPRYAVHTCMHLFGTLGSIFLLLH